jgi:hypothetical protein
MSCWWVNHKQTFKQETFGHYLWSPVVNKDGSRSHFYDNMVRVQPGDIVLSYAGGMIRALGVAVGSAALVPRPEEFGRAGEAWTGEGWKVPVRFTPVQPAVRPADHMNQIGPTLPPKYSPIRPNGSGNQGAYLSEVNPDMAAVLKRLLADTWAAVETQRSEGSADRRRIWKQRTMPSLVKSARGPILARQSVRNW